MRKCAPLFILILVITASGAEMALDYVSRFNADRTLGPDHLMTAMGFDSNRIVVGGNLGLFLVDLNSLPVDGTVQRLDHLSGVNARNIYRKGDYLFVNEHGNGSTKRYGFAVVKIIGDQFQAISRVFEPGVFFEKMHIEDNLLYVAAHSHGLWIYDISSPESPQKLGELGGFIDAFDVAVSGDRLYVADGAGGLKIVDVSNPQAPKHVLGETLETATGTAEAISIRNGRVYVAAGAAGLAVYDAGNIDSRRVVDMSGCAEDMAWVGDWLAVSNLYGVTVFDVSSDTPQSVAHELAHRRGKQASLRLCNGVGAACDSLVLCANWNFVDVYELKPAGESSQPDINASVQRIRFTPEGGEQIVEIENNGHADLLINEVTTTSPLITCDLTGGTLAPGEKMRIAVRCSDNGGTASGVLLLHSNDPDENPMPIQVFARTNYADPGEMAHDFTLPLYRKDADGAWHSQSFTLSDQRGKIVWFAIYGSW